MWCLSPALPRSAEKATLSLARAILGYMEIICNNEARDLIIVHQATETDRTLRSIAGEWGLDPARITRILAGHGASRSRIPFDANAYRRERYYQNRHRQQIYQARSIVRHPEIYKPARRVWAEKVLAGEITEPNRTFKHSRGIVDA